VARDRYGRGNADSGHPCNRDSPRSELAVAGADDPSLAPVVVLPRQAVRKQYHFWPAERGFDAWDVDRLIALSSDLPVESVRLESIWEIDTSYWFDGSNEIATVRKVVKHAQLISEVDFSYPIILGHDGRVMDGMHRVAKALLEGRAEIDAVRFSSPVEPDYRECFPDELPY
jgi:hypothetical protein